MYQRLSYPIRIIKGNYSGAQAAAIPAQPSPTQPYIGEAADPSWDGSLKHVHGCRTLSQ